MTMSKSKITFKKLPDDDPKKRRPDLSLANKELSWKPDINLKNGLVDTINYFEKKLFKN